MHHFADGAVIDAGAAVFGGGPESCTLTLGWANEALTLHLDEVVLVVVVGHCRSVDVFGGGDLGGNSSGFIGINSSGCVGGNPSGFIGGVPGGSGRRVYSWYIGKIRNCPVVKVLLRVNGGQYRYDCSWSRFTRARKSILILRKIEEKIPWDIF